MSKSRGILIAGNWKMNNGPQETERFFAEFKKITDPLIEDRHLASLKNGSCRICIFPAFVSLNQAYASANRFSFPISIGAQNAHPAPKGAFTGEISGSMLKELNLNWVLVGHSERRQLFHETDELVFERTKGLLEQGFKVILCVGETKSERENHQTEAVLQRQLASAIRPHIAQYLQGQLVIAYEPVWAIGTGLTATPEQAEEAHRFIRKYITQNFDLKASNSTPILYGGSVTPENIGSLLTCENVDGALVGGASLKPESFLSLVKTGLDYTYSN